VLKDKGILDSQQHHYYEADFQGVVQRKHTYITKESILFERMNCMKELHNSESILS
jgi:hypothetical protein